MATISFMSNVPPEVVQRLLDILEADKLASQTVSKVSSPLPDPYKRATITLPEPKVRVEKEVELYV